MQQVWCRPWNRSTIVGNNKGVDDHRMLFLQHVNNKNVCYHHFREHVRKGLIKIFPIDTKDQVADFAPILPHKIFRNLR